MRCVVCWESTPAAMAERRKIFGAASNGDVLGVCSRPTLMTGPKHHGFSITRFFFLRTFCTFLTVKKLIERAGRGVRETSEGAYKALFGQCSMMMACFYMNMTA